MSTVGKFFTPGPASDAMYCSTRDSWNAELRDRIEELWTRYEPYCPDSHFLSEARNQFVQRVWEMHLAVSLLDSDTPLVRPSPEGPDIRLATDPPTWIEAIAALPGTGPDAVLPRDQRGYTTSQTEGTSTWHGHGPSEESLILRCTHAVETKRRVHQDYVAKGIVGPNDPFVVAVSLAGIPDADMTLPGISMMMKAMFGIGQQGLIVFPYSDRKPVPTVARRPEVVKKSGERVDAAGFISGRFNEISGVMFSDTLVHNTALPTGSDITFLHNRLATNPIPRGTFRIGKELWSESDGTIARTVWSRPRTDDE